MCGDTGVIHITFESGLTIGHPFDIEYAVDPVGDEIIIPSDRCIFTKKSLIYIFALIIFINP